MIKASPLGVNQTCKTFEMPTSTYYYRQKKLSRVYDETQVLEEIRKIKAEFIKYGYRRVTKELHRRGIIINSKKVRKLMKQHNLIVKRKRYTPRTTNSRHKLPRYQNLMKDVHVFQINQVWVTDITYIAINGEFAYLAHIMDLASRRIVGWELGWDMSTKLTKTALKRAVILRGKENVKGCIHHSDHGSQYLAFDYMQELSNYSMLPSMGEVGNSYDNAFAESLNKTIKNEEVWTNEYVSFIHAYESIATFVAKYNERRLHSSIGYITPLEFEEEKV